jgi:alkylhydroperoxidase family enzyme
MTWLSATADETTPMAQVFGLSPVVYERFADLHRLLWAEGSLDPALLELVRLRIAQLHRADAETRFRSKPAIEAGLDEAKVTDLPHWPVSSLFSARDRAVLAFVEQYTIDAHGVGPQLRAEVGRHLSGPELAALNIAMAVFDASTRFRLALGIEPPSGVTVVDPVSEPLT